MSKGGGELKSAIQSLKIGSPFDLRKQSKVALSPPEAPAPIVDARNELPKSEQPQLKVPPTEIPEHEPSPNEGPKVEAPKQGGFFRLAHSVFGDAELRSLSGDAFRLFIWMSSQAWRFQNSDGTLRASISYIEFGTGISHATISRALAQLKEQKLVELVHTDFKKGNVWRVSRRAAHWPGSEGTQIQGSHSEKGGPTIEVVGSPELRESLPRSEVEERSIRDFKLKSQNQISHFLRDQEKKDADDWERKEKAFKEAFPSLESQNLTITSFCSGLPFPPSSQFAKAFAIQRWWESLRSSPVC